MVPGRRSPFPQVKEQGPDGYDRLKMRTVYDADGSAHPEPETRRCPDILREVLQGCKVLLQMCAQPLVVVAKWQDRAMELQCKMCTSRSLGRQAREFFCGHPSTHFALVHSVDTLREQNYDGDATEGRMLMMEACEHCHQLHMLYVKKYCRQMAQMRSHDLIHVGQMLRGLSIEFGFCPVCFQARPRFH